MDKRTIGSVSVLSTSNLSMSKKARSHIHVHLFFQVLIVFCITFYYCIIYMQQNAHTQSTFMSLYRINHHLWGIFIYKALFLKGHDHHWPVFFSVRQKILAGRKTRASTRCLQLYQYQTKKGKIMKNRESLPHFEWGVRETPMQAAET